MRRDGGDCQWTEFLFEGKENILKFLVVMVAELYEYTENH